MEKKIIIREKKKKLCRTVFGLLSKLYCERRISIARLKLYYSLGSWEEWKLYCNIADCIARLCSGWPGRKVYCNTVRWDGNCIAI